MLFAPILELVCLSPFLLLPLKAGVTAASLGIVSGDGCLVIRSGIAFEGSGFVHAGEFRLAIGKAAFAPAGLVSGCAGVLIASEVPSFVHEKAKLAAGEAEIPFAPAKVVAGSMGLLAATGVPSCGKIGKARPGIGEAAVVSPEVPGFVDIGRAELATGEAAMGRAGVRLLAGSIAWLTATEVPSFAAIGNAKLIAGEAAVALAVVRLVDSSMGWLIAPDVNAFDAIGEGKAKLLTGEAARGFAVVRLVVGGVGWLIAPEVPGIANPGNAKLAAGGAAVTFGGVRLVGGSFAAGLCCHVVTAGADDNAGQTSGDD